MNILINKFKEVILSVLPITLIVLILNFTIASIETDLILRFIAGAILIIIGLSIFLLGTDIGIEPIGSHMGSALTKRNKKWFLIIFGFILGFFITIAEPDLQVLTEQISAVTSDVISKPVTLAVVSTGVGVALVAGLMRIVHKISLNKLLTMIYGVIFILSIFSSSDFLAIAFDASGATTGSMSVPFVLALGIGVSKVKGGRDSEEDSFGLNGLASTGPIISVLILGMLYRSTPLTGSLSSEFSAENGVINPFVQEIPRSIFNVTIVLLPIIIIFFIFQILFLRLSKRKFAKILKGIVYTFIGLVIFLTGVNAGFMEAGSAIGYKLASIEYNWVMVPIGAILGLTVIFAEPAVHVLNEQVENVTNGHIRAGVMLCALSIGVAFAVALSMIRIMVPGIKLWHYLLPVYSAAIIMSYFVPRIFVGIAFDSGGIASGPMTATFILAFAQGAAEAIEGASVLIDAFGIIASVSFAPLLAIQVLGLIYKFKTAKRRVENSEE